MQKLILALVFLISLIIISNDALQAQDSGATTLPRAKLPIKYLPYNNPFEPDDTQAPKEATGNISHKDLDDFQKDILQRINDVYKIHIKSVQDQINNDPLDAEKHITGALTAIQKLLDDYPEVQGDDRFNELYRTVYTEYREFYGIKDSTSQVNGEAFAIQQELNSNDDDWMKGGYSLPENITKPKTEVPLIQNRAVNRNLMYFTLKRPEVIRKWLERSKTYFPMMKKIFREEGLPPELVHLAMIESGLNPHARSWASAVGMWQFIRATGSMYGLEINWWMDERRDPEKATRAAARHLKDLYNIWGDWYLAMANYNISPRGLKRAIREDGGIKDYWAASPYLPRETQNYVPSFIATTLIDQNAKAFGFSKDYKGTPYSYDIAEVAPLMSLDDLADAAGITAKQLKDLNPELLRWATPPGSDYPLKLPKGTKDTFAANYKKIPKGSRSQHIAMHTVHRGETLGYIARKYGTSVRALFASNEKLSSTIYPGQKIVVPLPAGGSGKIAARTPSNQPRGSSPSTRKKKKRTVTPTNKSKIYYTVKRGDTIGNIAEWYDVHASQIRGWNNTSNTINIGEKLAIYVPKNKRSYYAQVNSFSFTKKQSIEKQQRNGKDVTTASRVKSTGNGKIVQYQVRKNDTLSDIASTFGVSITDIRRTNNLKGSRIYVGQKLRIKNVN